MKSKMKRKEKKEKKKKRISCESRNQELLIQNEASKAQLHVPRDILYVYDVYIPGEPPPLPPPPTL